MCARARASVGSYSTSPPGSPSLGLLPDHWEPQHPAPSPVAASAVSWRVRQGSHPWKQSPARYQLGNSVAATLAALRSRCVQRRACIIWIFCLTAHRLWLSYSDLATVMAGSPQNRTSTRPGLSCLLMRYAQHTSPPPLPAVGPSLFQMSFLLLSNLPATHSEPGLFFISLGGLQFYVIFLNFILCGLILLARLLENVLLLFYHYFVLYYPISSPINIVNIFLKRCLFP